MKKLLIGILLLMLIVSCADKPETVVSKFIDNVKEKKIEKAFKDYVVNKDAEGSMHLEYNNKIQQLLFERLFENLEYKILETKKEDANTSVVTVEIKNIDVKKLDMLKIDELGKFDTIINVGNTLPHLNSKDEIFLFLQKAYSQLENNGKLIIQLINFYKFFDMINKLLKSTI